MADISKSEWQKALKEDERQLEEIRAAIKTLESGGEVANLTLQGAHDVEKGLSGAISAKKRLIQKLSAEEDKTAVAPPGWEPTVKKMKKHPEIDNPWALAWWMKGEGAKPGGKEAMGKQAMEFDSPEALEKYLKAHPNADRAKHKVKDSGGGSKTETAIPKEIVSELASMAKGVSLSVDSHASLKKLQEAIGKGDAVPHAVLNKAIGDLTFEARRPQADKKDAAAMKKMITKLKGLRSKQADVVQAFENALLVERVASRYKQAAISALRERVVTRVVEATDFPSQEALREYLKKHPNADSKKHHVRTDEGGNEGRGSGAARTKVKPPKEVGAEIAKAWKGKPSGNAVDGLRKMIEDGREVSLHQIDSAVTVINNAIPRASGDEAKALRALKTKVKSLMKVKD